MCLQIFNLLWNYYKNCRLTATLCSYVRKCKITLLVCKPVRKRSQEKKHVVMTDDVIKYLWAGNVAKKEKSTTTTSGIPCSKIPLNLNREARTSRCRLTSSLTIRYYTFLLLLSFQINYYVSFFNTVPSKMFCNIVVAKRDSFCITVNILKNYVYFIIIIIIVTINTLNLTRRCRRHCERRDGGRGDAEARKYYR